MLISALFEDEKKFKKHDLLCLQINAQGKYPSQMRKIRTRRR